MSRRRRPCEDLEAEQCKYRDRSMLRPNELAVSADKGRETRPSRQQLDHVMHHGCGKECRSYSDCKCEIIGLEQESYRI